MDLQQSSWFSEVRAVGGCAKGFVSWEAYGPWHLAGPQLNAKFCMPSALLALCGTACQLFHFALGRTAGILPGLQRIVRLALLARCALGFLPFFFGQFACVCHDCCLFLLKKYWKT